MGRKRKTSNSTVATVESTVKYARETNVIKPVALEDYDSVTIVLQDAAVYDKHGKVVDLLSVISDGPFTVRGCVKVDGDPNLEERLLKPNIQAAHIEISDCVRYSVGEDDSNKPCVWAGGRCGWYELRPPSAKYASIYNKMSEAVALYYTMLDIHEKHERKKPRKHKKGAKRLTRDEIFRDLAPDTVFFKYAVAIGDGSVKQDVIERCNEHAPFLICHFYQDTSYQWEHTTLFKWLTGHHKEIHAKVLENERKKQVPGAAPAPAPPVPNPINKDEITTDDELSAVKPPVQKAHSKTSPTKLTRVPSGSSSEDDERSNLPGRPSSPPNQQTPTVPTTHAEGRLPSEEETITALKTLVEAIDEIRRESTKKTAKIRINTITSRLYFKCKMKSYDTPREILIYYAKALVPALDGEVWGASPFYADLKEAARGPLKVPTHIPLNAIPNQCLRRKEITKSHLDSHPASSPAFPKADGKLPTMVEGELLDDSQAESSAAVPPRKRGRPAGKMSGLRLAGTSKKRYTSQDDGDLNAKASKMAKTSPFFDDEEDDGEEDQVMGDASSADEDDEDEELSDPFPPVKIVVRAERLPSTVPRGPNGTWICEEEDCGYVVRNADDDEGQDKIYQHLQYAHSQTSEGQTERINLAVTESRGHIPIDHLLEKLRKMGEKVQKSEQLELDGEVLAQPIKRRLII